jgi:virginiamycin B lyase
VTLVDSGEVARLGRDVQRFAVGARPRALVAGPDGALWFTLADAIGRLTVAGELSTFAAEEPQGLCIGPDRAIWFTAADHVHRVGGEPFPVPGASQLTSGPDGALWITLPDRRAIARLDPRGRLELRETSSPTAITATHDAVWFTAEGRLGRIPMDDPLQELELDNVGLVVPAQADGVWVGVPGAVAHVAFDGDLAMLPLGEDPRGLAIGPDEALWGVVASGVEKLAG